MWWLFLLFFAQAIARENAHFFSVCAMFKNEAPYLREWIEYHRLQGAEKFYLYDNGSTDHFKKVLEPYVKAKIVQLIAWPNIAHTRSHVASQTAAYENALKLTKNSSTWVAFIDIDEFIVPLVEPTVAHFLHSLDEIRELGAVYINWQLYGTSFIKKLAPKALVTENFILKACQEFDCPHLISNSQVKAIVKPQAVRSMAIHRPKVKEGYLVYSFKGSSKGSAEQSQIRINHYWTRDEDFFYNVKIARKETVFRGAKERMIAILADLNAIEDRCIYRFLPALKERLK